MRLLCFQAGILAVLLLGCSSEGQWKEQLDTDLHEFGHRNWIVVADYAYPSQSAGGIKTIFTGEDHLTVLEYVLDQIEQSPHISPTIMIDQELDMLSEESAEGIERYRSSLANALGNRNTSSLPHLEIISRLDETSELFNVLILKTNMTLPYTSVFIELDCAYWDSDKERKLRNTTTSD
jgi:hypothetical protein